MKEVGQTVPTMPSGYAGVLSVPRDGRRRWRLSYRLSATVAFQLILGVRLCMPSQLDHVPPTEDGEAVTTVVGTRTTLTPISRLANLGKGGALLPAPLSFFTDTTGIVSKPVATRLEKWLRDFQKATSNQLLVVVTDRVPEGYSSMEDYTKRVANAWGAGSRERNNGVVLFVFVADRKARIEVGTGLEGALPDSLASRIMSDEIVPKFRAGLYEEGLLAGIGAIMRATRGHPPIALPSPDYS